MVELLCCGRTNREISECLNIGLATVKTHLIHIFEKLRRRDPLGRRRADVATTLSLTSLSLASLSAASTTHPPFGFKCSLMRGGLRFSRSASFWLLRPMRPPT